MKLARDEELEVPLAPLIDIVFLLIIFFVVTATLQNDQIDETINLAKSYNAPPEEQPNPTAVIVNIKRTITGGVEYNISNVVLTLPQLRHQLNLAKQDQGGVNYPVIIRADWNIRWKDIEAVNAILGDLGMYTIVHSSESLKD